MARAARNFTRDIAFLEMYDQWIKEDPTEEGKQKLRAAQASWARSFGIDISTRTYVGRLKHIRPWCLKCRCPEPQQEQLELAL